MIKVYKFFTASAIIIVIFSGCSPDNTTDNRLNIDYASEVVTAETDEEVITSLEKMEKFTFGYEQVAKDTAVIAGKFETNSTEIKIEFTGLTKNEQIAATLYSNDNQDNAETVIATAAAASKTTDITFTGLTSSMTYILEFKNISDKAVDINCLISR